MNKLVLLFLFPLIIFSQQNIVDFFDSTYIKYEKHIQNKYNAEYHKFCKKYKLNKNHYSNKNQFYKLIFLNKLFTTNYPIDCNKYGILEIPYFFNWRENKSRVNIIGNSKGNEDRTPEIYLTDLVSEKPKYYHHDCGFFHTYGWCSEREMSFIALLHEMEIPAKVIVEGAHSSCEVYLELVDQNNITKCYVINIDNTYDRFDYKAVKSCKTDRLTWLNQPNSHSIKNCKSKNGSCAKNKTDCSGYLTKYYNEPKHKNIQKITVTKLSQERIHQKIDQYFQL